ncbi:MAG: pilus assembly protein PilM [Bdellovibrionales bacterium]|nr:pilus assembly protein PilM [Bdellovibrionales bacterium]
MISVGIDIGSYGIRVAEIEATPRGYVLKRFLNIPLSIDPKKDKDIEILDALRNLVQEYDHTNTKFILGVHQNQITLRRLTFPFRERHKIIKSLAFELEDDIPISQDDAVFNAKIIEYIGNSTEVLAIACPKKVVEQKIQLSADCNFPLDIISINNLALANLFTNWYEAPPLQEAVDENEVVRPAEIILDIGHQITNLIVLKAGQVVEVRDFDWGGIDLANTLASKKSIHITEAIRDIENNDLLQINYDIATQDQIQISDCIKQEVDKLTQQLKLTLLELKSLYNLNYVKATLVGGLSAFKNLTAYLTQKTEIPFKRIDIRGLIPESHYSLSLEDGFLAATSIGLAIEGIKKPKNPAVNLRVGEYKKQSQTLNLLISKWGHTLSIAVAIFVFFVIYGILRESFTQSMADKAETALREHGAKILGIKPTRVSVKKVNEHIHQQKKIQKNLKMTESLQSINSALDVLNLISQKTPSHKVLNLNVKTFQLQNENLRIEGEVKGTRSINQLKKALKNLALNNKVDVAPSSIKAQAGWTAFAFDLKVKRREDVL